jgi:uncharacterized protein YjbI with pentapeptide repeats
VVLLPIKVTKASFNQQLSGGVLAMYFNLSAVNKVLEIFRWNQQNEFLKPQEAVKLLMVTEEEFFDAVRLGQIPGNQISGRWRFSRTELLRFCGRRFARRSLADLTEEREYFFDDEEAYESRAKQVVEAYKQGKRDFFCNGAIENGDFSGLDLSGINFWDCELTRANFSGCVLRDATFVAAGLDYANFEGADLTGADFREAIVKNANFTGANLTKVDFSVDCLTGVDLSRAIICQTRF